MAIITRDGLISAIAVGRTIQFQKASMTSVAGFYYSHFRNGGMPAAGAAAPGTTGVTLSRITQGAMPIPAPVNTSYISTFEGAAAVAQTLILADRLVEFGQLSGIVTTAQPLSALALPARAASAVDVELWIEMFAASGTTAVASVTASYTNQEGTAGRTATLLGGFPTSGTVINRSYPMSLQANDTGVQSVQSLTLGTSTALAGNIGLVLRRTLLTGPVLSASAGFVQGWAETNLQQCPDDACLELLTLASASSTGATVGSVGIAQG